MSLRAVASVATATLTHSFLALALSILLARLLGPAGRGTYAMLTLTATLAAALGTLGFESGNVFALSRSPRDGGGVLAASMTLACVCGAALFAAVNLMASHLGASLLPQVPLRLLAIATLAIPFLILAALLNGALAGLGRVSLAAWLSAGGVLSSLIMAVVAALVSNDLLTALAIVFLLSSGFLSALQLGVSIRIVGSPLVDPRPALRSGLGYSLTNHAANLVHLLHLRGDVFLVNLFLSPLEVGLYALAQAVCEWVWLFPRAAATVLFPSVAGADPSSAVENTARTSRFVFCTAGVVAVSLAIVAGWLIPFLFGEAFVASVHPVRLLLVGIWIGSIAGSLSAFLSGRGRPVFPVATSLVSFLVNLILNLLLIPRFGIAGAAVTSALTYSLATILNLVFFHWMTGESVTELFWLNKDDVNAVRRAARRLFTPRSSETLPIRKNTSS